MLKPALIELDTAVVELKHFTAALMQEFFPRYQWPQNHAQLFYRAVGLVFDDALAQYLSWTPKEADTLADRVVTTLGLKTSTDTLLASQAEAFYLEMNEIVSDRVFQCLIVQLAEVIGTHRYNAWHVLPLGTARVLTPGGIMIDLDRFQGQSGVVEVNLAEHWSVFAQAGEQVETGPVVPRKDAATGPIFYAEHLPSKSGVKNLNERPSQGGGAVPTVSDDSIVADMMKDHEARPSKRGKRTRRAYAASA